MLRLNLALNNFAFHWSYPEIAADEQGLFSKNGVEVHWLDATPSVATSKTKMYTDLLESRRTDVYHAGEWACINRVMMSRDSWIVAKSPPGAGTLNSSFALFVRSDSGLSSAADLRGRRVAIEEGTGAQFTTLADLERYDPGHEVELVQVGEPHRRLMSLLRGEVDAASLVGPWSDIGRVLGFRELLRTRRTNPTTLVVRKDMAPDLLAGFLLSVNAAIGMIDADPESFKDSYLRRVKLILEGVSIKVPEETLRSEVQVLRWNRWVPYTLAEFEGTQRWMAERGLAKEGSHEGVVGVYPSGVFG